MSSSLRSGVHFMRSERRLYSASSSAAVGGLSSRTARAISPGALPTARRAICGVGLGGGVLERCRALVERQLAGAHRVADRRLLTQRLADLADALRRAVVGVADQRDPLRARGAACGLPVAVVVALAHEQREFVVEAGAGFAVGAHGASACLATALACVVDRAGGGGEHVFVFYPTRHSKSVPRLCRCAGLLATNANCGARFGSDPERARTDDSPQHDTTRVHARRQTPNAHTRGAPTTHEPTPPTSGQVAHAVSATWPRLVLPSGHEAPRRQRDRVRRRRRASSASSRTPGRSSPGLARARGRGAAAAGAERRSTSSSAAVAPLLLWATWPDVAARPGRTRAGRRRAGGAAARARARRARPTTRSWPRGSRSRPRRWSRRQRLLSFDLAAALSRTGL